MDSILKDNKEGIPFAINRYEIIIYFRIMIWII